MARVELPVIVRNSATGLSVSSAAITISQRSSGLPVTWFTTENGATSSTSAVITDANGRASAWVPRGAYTLTVTGTGITPTSQAWDAIPASDLGGDTAWLVDGAVTNAKIASGVDASKVTVGALPAARVGALSVPGTAMVDGAITLAKKVTGNGSKLLFASQLNGGNVAASEVALLSATNVTHTSKGCWVVYAQMYRATSGSGLISSFVALDGAGYAVSTHSWATQPDVGLLASVFNFPQMQAGARSWRMGVYCDAYLGIQGTATMDGSGIFMIFENN